MEKRRRICSLLLLAVFLPAILASFLHRHPHQISLTQLKNSHTRAPPVLCIA